MLIELDKVCRTYEVGESRVRALADISLGIGEGERVAVIGASGSGKTTMMNILGFLDRCDSGSYRLFGEDTSKLDGQELSRLRGRFIGFIFQSFCLIRRYSALENVELPLLLRGMKRSERRERAQNALQKVGLGERLEHMPNQLSGGQQQRVAIARALAASPGLILADEPTGNLDSESGKEVLQLLLSLRGEGEGKTTVIIITHDSSVAEKTDRVITIDGGRITGDRKTNKI